MKRYTSKELQKRLDSLEFDVISKLTQLVWNSEIRFNDNHAIEINLFGYKYLTVSNDKLVFSDGQYEYSLFADCTLQDLIEIIKQQE